jgi:hypothetical protein
MDIKIDPEFRDLIPPLSEVELDQLHSSLSASGCISPLIVWRDHDILIDGHNRFTYCEENSIDFTVRQMRFTSREVAKNWIILNQLGRRNVSPDMAAKLRGMLYISRKKSVGEHTGNQHTDSELGQSGPIPSTAEAVAKETGVSPRTIKRDAAYAEACDTLGISTASIASGEEKRSRSEIIATARPDKVKPKRVVKTPYEKILTLLPRLTSKELQDLHQLLESKF